MNELRHYPLIIVCYVMINSTLCEQIKGTKCALFSIKCKGAVWKVKHSCEVNLLWFLSDSAFQKVTIAFMHIYQHHTRQRRMNVAVHTLSLMAMIIYVSNLFILPYLRQSISARPNRKFITVSVSVS